MNSLTRVMLPGAPIIALAVAIVTHHYGLPVPAAVCAATAVLCAIWWVCECLNIAIVGLLPLVIFPATGVLSEAEVARAYGHPMILLLMSGAFLSVALEHVGAHRRVALTMVQLCGRRSPASLVLAFMLATAFLSMWISNTATTLMMVPIGLAVLSQAQQPLLRLPLLLGIAYSASIGGLGTPIGTPPNIMFMGQLQALYGREFGFGQWMLVAMPIVVLMLAFSWWWLTRALRKATADEYPPIQIPDPGPWRAAEVRVLVILAITALAWIFRSGPGGGWSGLLASAADGGQSLIGDTTIAVAASLALFLCPAGDTTAPPTDSQADPPADSTADGCSASPPASLGGRVISPRLLPWEAAVKIQWGMLLMFGGGVALAAAFSATGLSQSVGGLFSLLQGVPTWLMLLLICLVVTFLTEITSNTATAAILLPLLGELSLTLGMEPEALMVAGTISASCAFMMPVATPPNLVAFSAGGIRTVDMARNGLAVSLFGVVVIALVCGLML